ncbi:MAG: amylo-alpha-1,6-glucosidase [Sandaracinaceae bacterium]
MRDEHEQLARWTAREWLEPDGLGGFAMGTASGLRTRRYHGLLCPATTPPTGRVMLVNDVEAWAHTADGPVPLSVHRYPDGVLHPRGDRPLTDFRAEPWPTWTFDLPGGARIVKELVVGRISGDVLLTYRLVGPARDPVHLEVRPLLTGRDYHALHQRNPAFRFDADVRSRAVVWHPYPDLPAVTVLTDGAYAHDPAWFERTVYAQEAARGLDDREDLASPGRLTWALTAERPARMLFRMGAAPYGDLEGLVDALTTAEGTRRRSPDRLRRAAEAYLVQRGDGRTLIAGYPWFTDWGRDTFIAIRGICLLDAAGLEAARAILGAWARTVSEGMVPNRFTDGGEAPEYNSVDASLWFAIAAGELLDAGRASRVSLLAGERQGLEQAVLAILAGYRAGTRYGIRADEDGLVAAGEPGVQLTWMDAKVGDHVITPRIGKPVEVQALWVNALAVGERLDPAFGSLRRRAQDSFVERFWDDGGGYLVDVVDADHVPGRVDRSFRPNQILAVGGLPHPLVTGERAARIVGEVEKRLWTPMGLRSLEPDDPSYVGRYAGGVLERDGAYHQGTVWPWLIGPFVDAWLRVHGDDTSRRAVARQRFVEPLLSHLDDAGLGHVSEIADGDAPHHPCGAPFQAWSVAELRRVLTRLDSPGGSTDERR